MQIKTNPFRQIKGTCGFFAFTKAICELSEKEYTLEEQYDLVYYLLTRAYKDQITYLGELFHIDAFKRLMLYTKEYSNDFSNIELSICQWQGEFPIDSDTYYLAPVKYYVTEKKRKKIVGQIESSHYLMLTPDRYWESNRGWHDYHEPDDKYPNSKADVYKRHLDLASSFDWERYLSVATRSWIDIWLDSFDYKENMRKRIFYLEMQHITDCHKHIADMDNSMLLKGQCIKLEKIQK